MKKFLKTSIPTLIICTTAICLMTVAALAATAGSSSDPLVTLSYIQDTILPDLLKDVEDEAEDIRDDMVEDFADQVDSYQDEMESLLSSANLSSSSGSSSSASYVVVTLTQGQTVQLGVGCEVMLRVGSATVAGGSPALINTTSGETLSSGGALTQNHLYMATIEGRTLTATAATTKVLMRGDYTL